MRQEKRYERKQSPLTQIDWWRVVLDEAQMVENGVSNAAKVAQLIPRQNAWAVSGTPVIKDAKDLYGLLIFLRYQPYCLSTSLWERLVVHYRPVFWQIFEDIALRHTKDQIKDEILLPPQTVSIPSMVYLSPAISSIPYATDSHIMSHPNSSVPSRNCHANPRGI